MFNFNELNSFTTILLLFIVALLFLVVILLFIFFFTQKSTPVPIPRRNKTTINSNNTSYSESSNSGHSSVSHGEITDVSEYWEEDKICYSCKTECTYQKDESGYSDKGGHGFWYYKCPECKREYVVKTYSKEVDIASESPFY